MNACPVPGQREEGDGSLKHRTGAGQMVEQVRGRSADRGLAGPAGWGRFTRGVGQEGLSLCMKLEALQWLSDRWRCPWEGCSCGGDERCEQKGGRKVCSLGVKAEMGDTARECRALETWPQDSDSITLGMAPGMPCLPSSVQDSDPRARVGSSQGLCPCSLGPAWATRTSFLESHIFPRHVARTVPSHGM